MDANSRRLQREPVVGDWAIGVNFRLRIAETMAHSVRLSDNSHCPHSLILRTEPPSEELRAVLRAIRERRP